jgi:hypothetical protein
MRRLAVLDHHPAALSHAHRIVASQSQVVKILAPPVTCRSLSVVPI